MRSFGAIVITLGALAGITRDTVIRCARAAGTRVDLRALTRYELLPEATVETSKPSTCPQRQVKVSMPSWMPSCL